MKPFSSLYLLGALTVMMMTPALANDTSIAAIGGSAVALHHEHPYVQMVSETVRMDLYKDYYETTVDFVFTNHGAARDVLMGFPERGQGMDGGSEEGLILKFTTSVDGTPVQAKRIKAKSDRDTYQAYWTKTVAFGKNQKRRIHVQFRSPYGAGIDGTLAAYDFTGGNWRGSVQESVLIITPHTGAPRLPVVRLDDKNLRGTDATKPRRFAWHNWEAEGRLFLSERQYTRSTPKKYSPDRPIIPIVGVTSDICYSAH